MKVNMGHLLSGAAGWLWPVHGGRYTIYGLVELRGGHNSLKDEDFRIERQSGWVIYARAREEKGDISWRSLIGCRIRKSSDKFKDETMTTKNSAKTHTQLMQ